MTHEQLHEQTAMARTLAAETATALDEAMGLGGPHPDGPITLRRTSAARRRAMRLARRTVAILEAVNAVADDPSAVRSPDRAGSRCR